VYLKSPVRDSVDCGEFACPLRRALSAIEGPKPSVKIYLNGVLYGNHISIVRRNNDKGK